MGLTLNVVCGGGGGVVQGAQGREKWPGMQGLIRHGSFGC